MRYFLLVFFVYVTTSLSAITGTYSYTGSDPYDNGSYKGTAKIEQIEGDVYTCEWTTVTGETYKGTGIKNGDVLSFIFLSKYLSENIEMIGLIVYKINGNILSGPWIFWNQNLVGSEKLEKSNG